MATVKFSVPDALRQAFDATFEGQIRSATIAELMRHAVTAAQRGRSRAAAIARLSARRNQRPAADDITILKARNCCHA